jgi:flagellar biosynthesis/type III secretory pathway M-ring protein FliF/YscJ
VTALGWAAQQPPQVPDVPPFPNLPDFAPGPSPEIIVPVILILVAGVVLWPLVRAYARRLERGAGDSAMREELEHLRTRVAELEAVHQRVMELEERVDFSERLLIQRRPEALRPGEGGS